MTRKEVYQSFTIILSFRVKEVFTVSGEAMKIIFRECPHKTDPSDYIENYEVQEGHVPRTSGVGGVDGTSNADREHDHQVEFVVALRLLIFQGIFPQLNAVVAVSGQLPRPFNES